MPDEVIHWCRPRLFCQAALARSLGWPVTICPRLQDFLDWRKELEASQRGGMFGSKSRHKWRPMSFGVFGIHTSHQQYQYAGRWWARGSLQVRGLCLCGHRRGSQCREVQSVGCQACLSDSAVRILASTLSAQASTSRRLSKGFGGPVGCSPLFLSSFSSRWSEEGTEIHFRFDSLHSVAVNTRWAELIQNQLMYGIAMTTRIFVTARLLDWTLTGTTDSEHWHQRQDRDHTTRVHVGRPTRLMTDPWRPCTPMTLCDDVPAKGFSADCSMCPKGCFMMRSWRFQRRAQSTRQSWAAQSSAETSGNTARVPRHRL